MHLVLQYFARSERRRPTLVGFEALCQPKEHYSVFVQLGRTEVEVESR